MAFLKKPPKIKKKAKPSVSPDEKERLRRERAFINQHRSIFRLAGFERIRGVDRKHFEFEGVKSELDDIFVFENVVIFAEYTTSSGRNLGVHAKGKSGSHNKIISDPEKFIEEFALRCSGLAAKLAESPYTHKQKIFRVIYGSDPAVEDHHQAFFDQTKFMSRSERMYFKKLTATLRRSARYELFEFLGIDIAKVGVGGVLGAGVKIDRYHGTLLPEEHSNFPTGFRIASFYVDPEALLRRAYVLRQGGWRDSLNLYQRMIIPSKISGIRRYLREQHRVFANNIVITLPDNTEFRDVEDKVIDATKISTATPAWISLKDVPNSVGIVDGQHRVFSYYEDLKPDALIDKYRKQQNLLATGIVYPKGTKPAEKERFEAALFLEINSNQSGAKSDLKQAIWLILDPFRPVSVARTVVNRLAETFPLNGILEKSSYDVDRIRTTTIVTYGIQPLTKRSGKDSLFSIWKDAEKATLVSGPRDPDVLERYVEFCVSHIADFLKLIRESLNNEKWAMISKEGDGILSVTSINSFIILMRRLIESGQMTDKKISVDLAPLNSIDFKSFKSSNYAALADAMLTALTPKTAGS